MKNIEFYLYPSISSFYNYSIVIKKNKEERDFIKRESLKE